MTTIKSILKAEVGYELYFVKNENNPLIVRDELPKYVYQKKLSEKKGISKDFWDVDVPTDTEPKWRQFNS